MSVAVAHPSPWTVEDLYGLPEDGMRHELLDGTLLVTPPPSVPHQLAAKRLVATLSAAAPPEFEVLEAVGVTLPSGLLVPDVVVASSAAVHGGGRALDPASVAAIAEIVSPGSRVADRSWKPEAYAEAGIAVFLRVELVGSPAPTITLYELRGGTYLQAAVAAADQTLELERPFRAPLVPADLSGPRAG